MWDGLVWDKLVWDGHSCPSPLTLTLFSCNPYLQVSLQIKSAALKPRFQIFLQTGYATCFRRPPFSHHTLGSSGRFSICDNSFLISARRLARISTAD